MNMNVAFGKWLGTAVVLLVMAPAYAQKAAPASSLSRPAQAVPAVSDKPATAVQHAGEVALYQLPPGAYVLSYQDASGAVQRFDATVTWDPRQAKHDRRQAPDSLTISFGGREFAGAVATQGNQYASFELAAGHPVLDGELSADGNMSGRYYTDERGYKIRNPLQFSLIRKTAADAAMMRPASPGAAANGGSTGIAATRPGSREAINPQPLPPKQDPYAKPGVANAINPQPLPPSPEPNWGARKGDAVTINPQPLPPSAEPNWGTRKGDANSINPQPLPPKPEPNWNSKSSTAGAITMGAVGAGGSLVPGQMAAAKPPSAASAGTDSAAQAGHLELLAVAGRAGELASRRLRAAGLDPASPTFRRQLDARVQEISRSLAREVTATGAAPRVADAVRARLGDRAKVASSSWQVQTAAKHAAYSTTQPAPGPLDALPPFSLLDYKEPLGPMTMPGFYVIPFTSPARRTKLRIVGDTATVHITIPACGVDVTHAARILTAEQMGTMYADLIANSPEWHFEGREFALFMTLGDVIDGEFELGALPRHGTLTLAVNDETSKLSYDFAAMQLDSRWAATVDAEPPYLGANSLGLTTSNSRFGQPAVERVNLSDQTMQGEDILGSGIQLGAGYVAKAEIIASHSVADLGGDASPDNTYRGASVSVQPQANRLQTTVKWHIGPGDSLQYQVRWTLTGPYGQRALMTMPKQGICDS